MPTQNQLQQLRNKQINKLPSVLADINHASLQRKDSNKTNLKQIDELFPHLIKNPSLTVVSGNPSEHHMLRVGVVFSGGQASGGHNVIAGLYDALKKLHPANRLFGFLEGPSGIIENKYREITFEGLVHYRNQGGFDLIGSGRTKIEKSDQIKAAETNVTALDLDGLVIIGGDDSNTNAAVLAEAFLANNCKTCVVGVPKTIDGDLKNEEIEISFGFDTACKTYAETIGNLLRDALSAKKYYFFVKLMGRSASHIALECALQTHPNLTLIGEEIEESNQTLNNVVARIADMICTRTKNGKDYGVILVPEGIIEFIPEIKGLIKELNLLLAKESSQNKPGSDEDRLATISKSLTPTAQACFNSLPKSIQNQLLLVRDSHGNVQVSKIETERMLIEMVSEELKNRAMKGEYTGSFSPQPLFCGYEGRAGFPSNFDCQYCYALGYTAALLIDAKATGYVCTIKNLAQPVDKWVPGGTPLTKLMVMEERSGKSKPVIKKALVDLKGKPYAKFMELSPGWMNDDDYVYPGPIQYFGPPELTDAVTYTLSLESRGASSD